MKTVALNILVMVFISGTGYLILWIMLDMFLAQ